MRIELLASIPQIQSAIKIGGDGASRIQFDVPTSEMPELLKLVAYGHGKVLKLTIEVDESMGG